MTFLFSLWEHNTVEASPLPEGKPRIRISSVKLSKVSVEQTTNLTDQALEVPMLTLEILRQRVDFPVANHTAQELITLTTKSGQLHRMDVGVNKQIDILRWLANVETALQEIPNYAAFQATLDALIGALSNKSLTVAGRQESFKDVCEKRLNARGAFNSAVGALLRSKDNPAISGVLGRIEEIRKQAAVWEYTKHEEDLTFAFSTPTVSVIVDYYPPTQAHIVERNTMAEAFADVLARLNPSDLLPLLQFGRDEIAKEHAVMSGFLTATNAMLRATLVPRLEVSVVVLNPSRTPVTIAPWAALDVMGASGSIAEIVGKLSDRETKGDEFTQSSLNGVAESLLRDAIAKSSPEYVTIPAGGMATVAWEGDFDGAPDDWEAIKSAYDHGLLKCRMALKTFEGVVVSSQPTEFGELVKSGLATAAQLLHTSSADSKKAH